MGARLAERARAPGTPLGTLWWPDYPPVTTWRHQSEALLAMAYFWCPRAWRHDDALSIYVSASADRYPGGAKCLAISITKPGTHETPDGARARCTRPGIPAASGWPTTGR